MERARWQVSIIASEPAATVECTLFHHSSIICWDYSLSWCRRLWWSGFNSGSKMISVVQVGTLYVTLLCCLPWILNSLFLLSPLPWQPVAHKCNLIALCLSHTKCLLSPPHHPISPLLLYEMPAGTCLVNSTDVQTWVGKGISTHGVTVPSWEMEPTNKFFPILRENILSAPQRVCVSFVSQLLTEWPAQ